MGNALSDAKDQFGLATSKLAESERELAKSEMALDEEKKKTAELRRVVKHMKRGLEEIVSTPTEKHTATIFETRGNIFFYDDALERRNYDNAVDYMKERVQRCLVGSGAFERVSLEKIDEVSM